MVGTKFKEIILLTQLQMLAMIMCMFWRRNKRKFIKRINKKKMWIRPLFLERKSKGLYNILIKELWLGDHMYFFKYFRMSPTRFEQLLTWVAPFIEKSNKIRDASIQVSV